MMEELSNVNSGNNKVDTTVFSTVSKSIAYVVILVIGNVICVVEIKLFNTGIFV